MANCCKPDERDEDRTHHVRYRQTQYRNHRVLWQDTGGEIACSHNDAVADAEVMASRFNVGMKPRGKNGTWIGSEIIEGDGEKAIVWVDRGPADIEYDEKRWLQEAREFNEDAGVGRDPLDDFTNSW